MKIIKLITQAYHQFRVSKNRFRYIFCLLKYTIFSRTLGCSVKLPLRRDLSVVSDGKSASIGCAVLYDLFYEPRLMLFIEDWLRADDVFVDIGANIGIYSLIASRKCGPGRIIAIEANPNIFQKLKLNLEVNGLTDVVAVNCAAYDTLGQIEFDLVDGDCEGRILDYQELPTSTKINVEADTLPNILHKNNLQAVSIIKLDVEGAEIEVLKGAEQLLRDESPVIIIDFYMREVADFLEKFDYNPYRYSGSEKKQLLKISGTAKREHGSIFIKSDQIDLVRSRFNS